MMDRPLMPKATAVWLVQNTALTFDQIAEFCGLHPLEVQGIADGEVAVGMVGLDPVVSGQITQEEIQRCLADPNLKVELAKRDIPMPAARTKGPRYTPVAKRQDKPDAVAWLLRHHPELTDSQISKLIGTTKDTIAKIRDRSHWNSPNIRPRDPVLLGLCTQMDLNAAIERARRAAHRPAAEAHPAAKPAAPAEAPPVDSPLAETPAAETPIIESPPAEAPMADSDPPGPPMGEEAPADIGEAREDPLAEP
jgi:uncharacterized protein